MTVTKKAMPRRTFLRGMGATIALAVPGAHCQVCFAGDEIADVQPGHAQQGDRFDAVLDPLARTQQPPGEDERLDRGVGRGVDFIFYLAHMVLFFVAFMVGELRKGTKMDRISKANEKLQFAEGEADKLMLELLADLYSGKHDPVRVIFLKDLFELAGLLGAL